MRDSNNAPAPTDKPSCSSTGANAAWKDITAGTKIEVHINGQRKGQGTVDDAMPDGSVVWFWLDNGMGRQLLHSGDNAKITVIT